MTDRYANFAELAAELERGTDYRIRSEDRGSPVVVIAPHGGTIEPVTAQIAEEIAGNDFSFYTFEALKAGAHGDFHITSHRFDEPVALDLVGRAEITVAIHGRKDDGTDTVWLGGRAALLRDRIGASLREAGFEAELNTILPGTHETNICNRTRSRTGAQLELPRSLRRRLAEDRSDLRNFCSAIQDGIRMTI
ncbi:poly-gamma-glutamate hydrolase family protein [Palleronia sp. LCG004]|uniref:poly-gamma-glutamate hydrolase family protein n=1 Tax=Palleronia sp. LCG004 TaxID=3079304 RepID=UPI0029434234|nr:poly-gamma-glutamate hydrolase family protein [Palleronia sp. LCG004]WOI57471.1 poly-gamma-glutamate hydrolase family protein [Palleronia sp. LCG004]